MKTKFYIRYGKDGVEKEISSGEVAVLILSYHYDDFAKTWQKLLLGKIIKVGVQELFIK